MAFGLSSGDKSDYRDSVLPVLVPDNVILDHPKPILLKTCVCLPRAKSMLVINGMAQKLMPFFDHPVPRPS